MLLPILYYFTASLERASEFENIISLEVSVITIIVHEMMLRWRPGLMMTGMSAPSKVVDGGRGNVWWSMMHLGHSNVRQNTHARVRRPSLFTKVVHHEGLWMHYSIWDGGEGVGW